MIFNNPQMFQQARKDHGLDPNAKQTLPASMEEDDESFTIRGNQ